MRVVTFYSPEIRGLEGWICGAVEMVDLGDGSTKSQETTWVVHEVDAEGESKVSGKRRIAHVAVSVAG